MQSIKTVPLFACISSLRTTSLLNAPQNPHGMLEYRSIKSSKRSVLGSLSCYCVSSIDDFFDVSKVPHRDDCDVN